MSALERPPGAPNGSGSAIDPGAIQVVVGCDDKYACHLGVMLLSLFAHSKALPVHVHVMVPEGFSARPRLQQALAGHTRMLTYHVLAGDAVEGLKQRNDLTAATYYRLLISDVLPSDVTRVIYLDCDIMLRCDLVDLWRFSLGNAVAAAVPDPGFRHRQILGLPDDAPYFNGGVLLIDLDRWRGEAIGQNALAFATAHPDRLTYNDQCALNWALQGRWLVLDQAWNVQTANLSRIIQGEVHYFQPTPPFAAGARIVHFNAPGRPWLYMDDHPFKLDYVAYKKRTPWRAKRPVDYYPHNVIIKTLRRHAPVLLPIYRRIREYI